MVTVRTWSLVKTWSRGRNSRLPSAMNVMLDLSSDGGENVT